MRKEKEEEKRREKKEKMGGRGRTEEIANDRDHIAYG